LTLWDVSDFHTVRWLEEFYREMKTAKLSWPEIVRTIQLKFIQGQIKELDATQRHPYFWASFTFSGAPGRN